MNTGNVYDIHHVARRPGSDLLIINNNIILKIIEIIHYLKMPQKNFDTKLNFSDTTLHSGTNCVVFSRIPPDIHKPLCICRRMNHRMPDVPVPQIILYQTRIPSQIRQRVTATVP